MAEAGAAPIPAPRDGADGVGGAAPGPQSREAPGYMAWRIDRAGAASFGGGVVFADFGRSMVYALTDDGEDVSTFDSLEELVNRLSPAVIVVDSLPKKHHSTAIEIAKTGIVFLRLRDLKRLSEERKNNGLMKTDENDVKLLRMLYRRQPELFQPLFTSPEELEVRALTELWVELAGEKKMAKQTRTTTNNPITAEAHKTLRRLAEKLAAEIHKEALKLPLYRKAVEELGLKGPTLAYIISHDPIALNTLPRDKLAVRYGMADRPWRKRPLRRQLLILLATAAVLHQHPRYSQIYQQYRQKDKKHWPTILRVARIILRDLRKLAKGQQTQKAGPLA